MKLILVIVLLTTGCSNLTDKSAAYQFVHEKAYWSAYKSGGVDAAAWANYKAHEEAERVVGK
jgi:uncharacterized protein YceK